MLLLMQQNNSRSIKPDKSNTTKRNVKYIQLTLKSNLSKSIKKGKTRSRNKKCCEMLGVYIRYEVFEVLEVLI